MSPSYQTSFITNDKTASIDVDNGNLVFRSSYDAGLVAALKGLVPYTERKWDNARKAWIVAPKHAKLLERLCAQYFGLDVTTPAIYAVETEEIRILDIRYVGATKDRPGFDERAAMGYSSGDWSVVLPESVLLLWFTGLVNRVDATTLYGVLGISRTIDQGEIKTAFRRLARQWHPDVCKEDHAKEMFLRIKDAYDVLSNENKRARYDAGLALEATLKSSIDVDFISVNSYRPPLRCGLVQAEGTESVGRFLVKKIYAWEDITNYQGETLVTSWPFGDKQFVEAWV